jgi:PAS domain S-box-containing protein
MDDRVDGANGEVAPLESESHLYAMLLRVQDSILRASSAGELLQQVCDSAFAAEEVPGVFAALVDPATQLLEPAAFPAKLAPFLEPVRAFLHSASSSQDSPILRALRSGTPQYHSDVAALQLPTTLRILLPLLKVRGLAALPLTHAGNPVGVLALYVSDPDYLSETTRRALWAVAQNVSYALDRFEERKRLAESEHRFRSLVEQSIVGIYMVDESRFQYGNARLCEILGLSTVELLQRGPLDVVHAEDRALVRGKIGARVTGGVADERYEFRIVKPDGTIRHVGVHGRRFEYQGRPVVMGVLQDISDRFAAEKKVLLQMEEIHAAMHATVAAVSRMMHLRDPYTAGHERRVAAIACGIGREMGLDVHRIEGLDVIGGLHDIGKIAVPSEILTKPARLSSVEFSLVKEHASAGYQILKELKFPWPVAEAVLQHHERLDGSGYPQGLKGEAIVLEARILAIADVVESMASHRPYRAAIGIEPALAEIEDGLGKRYDAGAAAACLRMFRERGYRIPD